MAFTDQYLRLVPSVGPGTEKALKYIVLKQMSVLVLYCCSDTLLSYF